MRYPLLISFERRIPMARTIAELPQGTRISDYISLGVLARTFPLAQVEAVLARQKKASRRQRDLPAHVVVYYVIALALFMQVSYREVLRCLLEGLAWLLGPHAAVKITGKSGISQARTRLGGCATGETTLAAEVTAALQKGMLCLADRNFFGFRLWNQAAASGADLLWRVKKNMRLRVEKRLPDGSYWSRIYASERDWRHQTNGVVVRVIDYRLEGVSDAEPLY